MSVALQLFENLNDTHDERERNRLIVHAFEQLEERCLQQSSVAARTCVSKTELQLELQIKQVESDLKLRLECQKLREGLKHLECCWMCGFSHALVYV